MMADQVHNVEDRRQLKISSWKIEPLVYDQLTYHDIGRTVIYRGYRRAEAGTLTSYQSGYCWARFHQGDTAARCDPDTLVFGLEETNS